jgi:chorismate mutase / prephenate dehydratase
VFEVKKMSLEECRNNIDVIDAEIMELLNRRAGLSRRVGWIKTKAGLPIIDMRREDVILRKVVRENAGEISSDSVLRIYGEILSESRRIQIAIAAGATADGEVIR